MNTHLVLIPSFDTGPILTETVRQARAAWPDVWVVIDGSTDGSADHLPTDDPGLRVIRRPARGGKGAAVCEGLSLAAQAGFTHALVMDADGQHPAAAIAPFMACSVDHPTAMILGQPQFGADAPWARRQGRRISNALALWQTGGRQIADALFGFRVYPIVPLLAVMNETRRMRGYDFDPEAAVRLTWRGVPAITRPVPVRYPPRAAGGISHFRYGRDNWLLARMHTRLLIARLKTWRVRRTPGSCV